ncbi:MAG: DNA mismatch repair protein MutT [Fervidobacterium sp.]|nr:DNA mismatch repair protein MutT [Fervidobacterium sp.]
MGTFDEKVLVVKSESVEKICNGKMGVVLVSKDTFLTTLKNGFFVERAIAEYDESVRQVIPYIVLKENDDYIFFKRTSNQAEKRLHNMITLGVGGHLNIEDSEDPVECLEKGLWRELKEEVNVEVNSLEYIGLINELENPVSRVHVGVLYIAHVKYYGLAEPENFLEIRSNKLLDYLEEMEGWAKVVALYLERMQN